MKHRIKQMLIGLGFTFGLQAGISFLATLLLFNQSQTPAIFYVLFFGMTLGAFLVGGFVLGVLNDRLELGDAALMTIATLLLSGLVISSTAEGSHYYLMGNWLNDPSGHFSITAQSFVYVGLALVASTVGCYTGWRVGVPQEGQFDRIALLLGLLGAIVGPFLLFSIGGDSASDQQGLPWYFLAIVILVVLVIMGIGFLMFTRDSHHDEEISIHPPKNENYLAEPK
jgi:hypothetical protein